MLITLPDVIRPSELQNIHKLLAQASWTDGRDTAGSQARQVKNNAQLPADSTAAKSIQNMVIAGLERNPMFLTSALPKKIFPPRVNRYGGENNFYGSHVDSAIRTLAQTGQRVRTDISCTVFLSDPAEYDGGELCITDTYGDHRIKLPAGHAVLYPGTSLHQVSPVTRGERLACFFWIESLVRGDEQRRLLFDMDMALMQLRQEQGDNAATIALTGTYHNLLRMWADT